MCGIAGIVHRDRQRPVAAAALAAMGEALAHRGPDDAGTHHGPGVGLASRRLAVIDTSPLGRMPMLSDDGQVALVFNGEIYNHIELRKGLQERGWRFKSGADSEVLLNLYLEHGPQAVRQLIGMFAFAIWDGRSRSLLLVRDRLGVKPLLYREAPDGIRFASEMRGLLAEPGFDPEPDPEAIHHLVALRFVPRPHTAFTGVRQLPPAHLLIWEEGQGRLERYWSYPGQERVADRTPRGLEERCLRTLDDAVKLRLRSDVPVALLLSGGIDSSVIAYHMRRSLTGPFSAFTIGFPETDYDERRRAREVAGHFGIDLQEIEITRRATDDLERIVAHMQVPFADPSLLPLWLLSREVSRHVKVALVGDGGDETFGGYDRYRAHLLADRFGWLPGLLSRTPFYALLDAMSSEKSRRNLPGRLRRFLDGWELPARERNALWLANPGARRIRRLYQPEFAARVQAIDPTGALGPLANDWGSDRLIESLLRADVEHFLPDDLMFKADIASMAFGLELRSPFLDHRVVEMAAGLPGRFKIRGRNSKWFLRRLYRGRLPASILTARKAGFGLPLDHWLRGELHSVAHDLLLTYGACSRTYLNRDAVAAVLKIHRSGQRNYDELIWTLIVLELWLRGIVARRARKAA
ncbi:MAG TPA: asparagine synthase (glutamine-hydrolyzing) [Candidatus Polarisedimenticolia bacterium]|nr:asparagine synthase (glutamine-hydrolyzing) [Candidatus Polarisedimenticolia bacterium]